MVEVNKSVLHCQWGTGLIRAPCSWPSSSVALGQLHQQGLLGLKRAVGSSGSTVVAINAAKPVGLWAAARTSYRRAGGLIRATLVVALGMFDQLSSLCKIFL